MIWRPGTDLGLRIVTAIDVANSVIKNLPQFRGIPWLIVSDIDRGEDSRLVSLVVATILCTHRRYSL